jgi:DNA-binding NtrC family response regulator
VDEDPVERAWGMVALAERYDVYLAAGTADAQARLGSQQVDLVVTTSDGDGFALVEWLRAHHPGLPCLVTTGGVTAKAVAMRRRLPYVMRPLDKERLLAAVARVLSEK